MKTVFAKAGQFWQNYFLGERICQNFGSFVFEFGCRKWKRRGLGRNPRGLRLSSLKKSAAS